MRKIITQEERDRKTRKNQIIVGLMLIGLMIFSTLGFAFSNNITTNNSQKVKYNSIEFTQESGYWTFYLDDLQFATLYNPEEIKYISFNSFSKIQDYTGKPLYFVGEDGEHFSEIERNLANRFVSRINEACINNKECKGDFPVKDCSIDNIIIFKEAEDKEEIYQEDKCIFIISKGDNQGKYADAFLFKILGIN